MSAFPPAPHYLISSSQYPCEVFLSPFWRWGIRDSEGLSNLPSVRRQVGSGARTWIRISCLKRKFFPFNPISSAASGLQAGPLASVILLYSLSSSFFFELLRVSSNSFSRVIFQLLWLWSDWGLIIYKGNLRNKLLWTINPTWIFESSVQLTFL